MLRCMVFGLDADFDTEVIDCIVWDLGGAKRMLCIGRFGSDAPNYFKRKNNIFYEYFLCFNNFVCVYYSVMLFLYINHFRQEKVNMLTGQKTFKIAKSNSNLMTYF